MSLPAPPDAPPPGTGFSGTGFSGPGFSGPGFPGPSFPGPDTPALPPHDIVAVRAFGQGLRLHAPRDPALVRGALHRLETQIEPFLAAHPLAAHPPTGGGVALDVGAGFGAFALPFARACPGWTVWCLEPDPALFALLAANIADSGLANLRALHAEVRGDGPEGAAALTAALRAGDGVMAALRAGDGVAAAAALASAPMPEGGARPAPEGAPVLPAAALAALAPRLLRLAAPGAEAAILAALAEAPLDHVLGELAAPVPSRLIHRPGPGLRQAWLALPPGDAPRPAPLLALRRGRELSGRRPGLDVVVAMYNSAAFVEDCVGSLLANDMPDLCVRVVDDGSTDDGAARLRARFGADPRLVVHAKANGGCASARNYGRLLSQATHIAFVDADDRADADLFPQLLELARHTGAEVVQGGFATLHATPDGAWELRPGPEDDEPAWRDAPRRPFGAQALQVLPAGLLIAGQPTIWRRVYRRDFLDNRAIWFPEHIRAFDDQIFQLLTLQHARQVPTLPGLRYHYRQHPGQDIRQGDERAFHSLEMFRLVLKRALEEGWRDCAPMIRSFVNTVNWSHAGLRPDLRGAFLEGAAELWVWMERALPAWHFRDTGEGAVLAPDFPHHTGRCRAALAGLPDSPVFARLDARLMHAAMVAMPPPPVPPVPLRAAGPVAALPAPLVDGAAISLRAAAAGPEGPRFLDGDVPGQRVVLAPSTEPPFTGTRWTLRRGLDGNWLLLNQGLAAHCLAAAEGRPTLRPAGRWRDAALHWRIEAEGAGLLLGLAVPGPSGGTQAGAGLAAGAAAGDLAPGDLAPGDLAGGAWLCRAPDGGLQLADRGTAAAGAGLWLLD